MTIYRMVPGFHRTLEVQFARSVVLVCCSVHQQSDKRNIKRWHQKCDPICWHHPAVRDSDTRRSGLHRDVFLHLWNKLSVWCGRAEENPRCQPQRRVRFHFLSISKPNMNPFPSLVFVAVQTGGWMADLAGWGEPEAWRQAEEMGRAEVQDWPPHDSGALFSNRWQLQGDGVSDSFWLLPLLSVPVWLLPFIPPPTAAWGLKRGRACSHLSQGGDVDAASASVWAAIKENAVLIIVWWKSIFNSWCFGKLQQLFSLALSRHQSCFQLVVCRALRQRQ